MGSFWGPEMDPFLGPEMCPSLLILNWGPIYGPKNGPISGPQNGPISGPPKCVFLANKKPFLGSQNMFLNETVSMPGTQTGPHFLSRDNDFGTRKLRFGMSTLTGI